MMLPLPEAEKIKIMKTDAAILSKWQADPAHSEINFRIKHLMISNVKGGFATFTANIETDGANFENTRVNASIDAASITTGDTQRDTHLKGSDFFDVENYPLIEFKSTRFDRVKNDQFIMEGDLTMHGVTKPVTLDVEYGGIMKDPWGNHKAGFHVTGKINRKDWGLTWNAALETGGMLVSEEVKIEAEIQLSKVQENKLAA
jgi:polyisoprenoid-binding protein YceI